MSQYPPPNWQQPTNPPYRPQPTQPPYSTQSPPTYPMQQPGMFAPPPPMYPQRPPQRPNVFRRIWKWYRSRTPRTQVIIALILVIATILAGISNNSPTNQKPTATPVTHATAAPTKPTPKPTVKPTATPTPQHAPSRAQLDDVIASSYPPITVEKYEQSTGTLVVSISYGEYVNWSQPVIKKTTGDTQKGFWEKGWYFSSITVNVYKSLVSGSQKKTAYGVLPWSVAKTLNWYWGVDSASFWDKYSQKWMDASVPAE